LFSEKLLNINLLHELIALGTEIAPNTLKKKLKHI